MKKNELNRLKIRSLKDRRGVLLFPFRFAAARDALESGDIRDFHTATLKPGAVRGNHSHPHHDEYILCIGGSCTLVTRRNGKKRTARLKDALVRIEKNVPHAIANRGKGDLVILCFYKSRSDSKLTRVREEVL